MIGAPAAPVTGECEPPSIAALRGEGECPSTGNDSEGRKHMGIFTLQTAGQRLIDSIIGAC